MQPPEQPQHEVDPVFNYTWYAFIATIGITILYYLSSAVLLMALNIGLDDDRLAYAQAVSQVAFMLVPTILAMRFTPLGLRALMRMEGPAISWRQWLIIGMCFILVLCFRSSWAVVQDAILPTQLNADLHEFSKMLQSTLKGILGEDDWFSIARGTIIIGLIPAIAEELMFRGMMQRSIEESQGPGVALIHTALLFSVLHFNPIELLPLIVIALVLSRVATVTASLVPCMLLHFANNTVSVLAYHNSALRDLESSEIMPLSIALPLSLLSLAALLWCMWKLRQV